MKRWLLASIVLGVLTVGAASLEAAQVRRFAARAYYRPGYGYVVPRPAYGYYGAPRYVSYGWGYPGVAWSYPGYVVGNPYYYWNRVPNPYYGIGITTGYYGYGYGAYGWPGAYYIGY
jgi:hypothetical protein